MRRAAVAAAICGALAGCGGGSPPAPRASAPAPPPSATPAGATLQQYASVIARSAPSIRSNAKSIRKCAFGAMAAQTCALVRFSATLDPKTLTLRLRTVMQNDGSPPAEIADLVSQTMSDAGQTVRAAKSGASYESLSLVMQTLVEDLDSWKPYGA